MKNIENEYVLLVNICEEQLHTYEFVNPIADILRAKKINFFVRSYKQIGASDLDKCSKVIICGTSLSDFEYLTNISFFSWLSDFDKPVLGICGGMQIMGLVFGGKLKRKTEIGLFSELFTSSFLGLSGKTDVYHLHNAYIDFSLLTDFKVFAGGKVSQAVQHLTKPFYGVLFHPEVRQKKLLEQFILI